MVRRFIRSLVANFVRMPFASVANLLTLALGLACFIAAYGIATYWRSGDNYHPDAARIFVIGQTFGEAAEHERFNASSSFTIARYLKVDMPELKHVTRTDPQSDVTV